MNVVIYVYLWKIPNALVEFKYTDYKLPLIFQPHRHSIFGFGSFPLIFVGNVCRLVSISLINRVLKYTQKYCHFQSVTFLPLTITRTIYLPSLPGAIRYTYIYAEYVCLSDPKVVSHRIQTRFARRQLIISWPHYAQCNLP